MDYLKLVIETTGAAAEVLAAALSHISPYCEIDDPGDVEELRSAPSPRWDYLGEELFENEDRTPTLTFYFDQDEQGSLLLGETEAAVRQLKSGDEAGFYGSLCTRVERVRSEDWENNWKQYYKPFAVGQRLLVRPSWEEVPDAQGRKVLTIDPASSFGTGSHATTRLCMEALDGMELDGARVLDMGCGSGILAAAAVLLGARYALLCDIEETAVKTAAETVRRAGQDARGGDVICDARCGNWLEDEALAAFIREKGPFDVVCANIVADVLLAMRGGLTALLRKGGVILLSGIIESRRDEVFDAYVRAGMTPVREEHRDGWVMICLKK